MLIFKNTINMKKIFTFLAALLVTTAAFGQNYCIMVNGQTTYAAEYTGEVEGGFTQYLAHVPLVQGDTCMIFDQDNMTAWISTIEESSVSGVVSGQFSYLCTSTGCYDFYVKLQYLNDRVYIGAGTDCTGDVPVEEPQYSVCVNDQFMRIENADGYNVALFDSTGLMIDLVLGQQDGYGVIYDMTGLETGRYTLMIGNNSYIFDHNLPLQISTAQQEGSNCTSYYVYSETYIDPDQVYIYNCSFLTHAGLVQWDGLSVNDCDSTVVFNLMYNLDDPTEEEPRSVTITMQSAGGATDVLHLIEGENFTSGFDQGYDVQKVMNTAEDGGVVNIYAVMADGTKLSTLATNDLSDIQIEAVSSATDSDWTLTFTDVVGKITLHNDAGGASDLTVITDGMTMAYRDLPTQAVMWSFVINYSGALDCEPYESTEQILLRPEEFPYTWEGNEYTEPGQYSVMYTKSDGCDSILNLILDVMIEDSTSIMLTPGVWTTDGARFAAYYWTEVDGEVTRSNWSSFFRETEDTTLYVTNIPTWATKIIFTRFDPTSTHPAWGQDNVWNQTEDLDIDYDSRHYIITGWDTGNWATVCPTDIVEEFEAIICEGDTFFWEMSGRSYYESGAYDYVESQEGECDLWYRLNLTVNKTSRIEEIVSVREDRLPYTWHRQTLTESGDYYDTVRYADMECDSICYTLRFTVTQLPIYTVNVLADHGFVNGTGTYPEGTQISLTAVPDENFEFQMWSDGSTLNPKNFTVMQDTTFRALFFMPEVEQEVVVDSIETNSVTITWDTVPGATLYELTIYKNGKVIAAFQVDKDNNIVNEHFFGPERIIARRDSTGGSSETLQVNIGGLEPGQDYTYSLDALDDDRSYVGAQSGSFTTEEEPIDGLEQLNTQTKSGRARKLLREGCLYIELPNGTTYDAHGQRTL